jgi:hypothetical protein
MPYDFSRNDPGSVTATELVISILDQVDAAFYDVLYPEILWRQCIPEESIKTDISPGAINHVYRARDTKGMGQFVQGDPKNIPRVGQTVNQITVPILDAAVGATVTDAEARRYAYGFQTALAQDLGEVMRKAADYHMERVFFFGDALGGFQSYQYYTSVTKYPADAWIGTDPSAWVKDIQDNMTAMWLASKTVHMPNVLEMPPTLMGMLQLPMVIGSGAAGVAMSGLEYLKQNNPCKLFTNQELQIRPLRYLEGAGVAGANRIIMKEENSRNFVMPLPMAYQLAQPVPIPLGTEMFAEYIFGSYNIRYIGSVGYMDVAQADAS